VSDAVQTFNRSIYRNGGGFGGKGVFCSVPHPDNPDPDVAGDADFVFCRLLEGHQNREVDPKPSHAAFIHSISEVEEWDDPIDLDSPSNPPF
jgi:hypothetical protein